MRASAGAACLDVDMWPPTARFEVMSIWHGERLFPCAAWFLVCLASFMSLHALVTCPHNISSTKMSSRPGIPAETRAEMRKWSDTGWLVCSSSLAARVQSQVEVCESKGVTGDDGGQRCWRSVGRNHWARGPTPAPLQTALYLASWTMLLPGISGHMACRTKACSRPVPACMIAVYAVWGLWTG